MEEKQRQKQTAGNSQQKSTVAHAYGLHYSLAQDKQGFQPPFALLVF